MYKFNIIPQRKIWFSLSGILVVLSVAALFTWGLNFGIDFTGGSLLEVQFPADQRPEVNAVRDALADLNLSSLTIQPTDNNGLIFRFQEITEETHQEIMVRLRALSETASEPTASAEESAAVMATEPQIQVEAIGNTDQLTLGDIQVETTANNTQGNPLVTEIEELRFEAVGPSIGQELRRKAIYSIILVLLAIIAYVAWAFRKVSKPVASWKYGLASIIALFHDLIITMGVFSVLGRFMGVEINTTFVAAMLMVLGYSVNDTIVVFDRVRENLPKSDLDFQGTVNYSVNQTITRSINTSFTTLLVLLSIVIWGGETIRYFALALLVGVFVGTYSSIFLASPLLVWFDKLKK